MRRFIFRFCITLLTFLIGVQTFFGWEDVKGTSYSDQLSLSVVSEAPVLKVGEDPLVKVYITNYGNETVTLVHPGDGSDYGWRTPTVGWSVREAGDSTPATSPDVQKGSRCGNMNSLKRDEVFSLGPGETKVLDSWLFLPLFRKPGTYKVKFFYANRPLLQWRGIEPSHDRIAMWRVRNSTETNLSSNELLFTVTE
jgi:hypothetical protein